VVRLPRIIVHAMALSLDREELNRHGFPGVKLIQYGVGITGEETNRSIESCLAKDHLFGFHML
jgi:hypothetical protein